MKISIYQINFDRDYNDVAFRSLEALEKIQETSEIDSELYDRVFEGEVACDNLEEVYEMFNCSHPEGYRGRSLYISDVVEMNGKFYYCDNIGWKEIEFDSYLTGTLKEDKIKVVLCEPGETAKVVEIENTLESLQKTVGGYIETFYPYEEEVCMVCNDEGKFNGMQPSRAVRIDKSRRKNCLRTIRKLGKGGEIMTREEIIKSLQGLASKLAEKYSCTVLETKEDRQKGFWGEGLTKYLEEKFGECTEEFTISSEKKVDLTHYNGEGYQKPELSVCFRYRFADPCLSIERYEGKKQIFAEMEITDWDAEKKEHTNENWHIGQFTVFEEEGLEYANELKAGFHEIEKEDR